MGRAHRLGTMPLTSIWQRLPVIVRAILTGLALSAAGTIPWALLTGAITVGAYAALARVAGIAASRTA